MLRAIRRLRALAVTLLLAAPGLGGTWLSLAHPCPVDMPWLAETGHGDHGAQPSHGHEDAPDGSSSSCSCVGACQGATVPFLQSPVQTAVAPVAAGWTTTPDAPEIDPPVAAHRHRHPPATAPPLA